LVVHGRRPDWRQISYAQREGIDATTYLTDIFKRLPTEMTHTVHRLTPNAWAAEQVALRQALAQSAVVVA
jgi:hypothetical protein